MINSAPMQDTTGIVKAGLFLALVGIGACLLVIRLVRRLARMEQDLLKIEKELEQEQEQLRNRLHS